jgi:hypothetical protein
MIGKFWNWEIGKSRSLSKNDPANNLATNWQISQFPNSKFQNYCTLTENSIR